MFADTPVDQILTMLNEVNELLSEEQKSEDNEIYEIRKECNIQIELLDKSINFHNSTLQSLAEEKQSHENLLKAIEMKEKDVSNRIQILNNMLNEEKIINNKSIQVFQEKIIQLTNATDIVNEALSLVSHLKTDASFVQLEKSALAIQNKLAKIQKTNHQISPLLTILSVLGKITQNGDQEALDQILKLLNKIKESYANEIVKEQEREELRQKKIQNYISQLNQESMNQQNKLEISQKEKQQNTEILGDIERSITFHSGQLQKFINSLERMKEYCLIKNEEYERTTNYRLEDRKALDMLIPQFKEKAKALKQYFQKRSDVQF